MKRPAQLIAALLVALSGQLPAQTEQPAGTPLLVVPGATGQAPAEGAQGAGAAAPAGAARADGLAEMQARLQRVERVLNNEILLEMMRSIDRMQAEVRELRGEVERQTHELDSMRQRQRDLYLDSDRRLRELELGGARTAPQQAGAGAAPAPGASVAPSVAGAAAAAGGAATAAAPAAPADPEKERDGYNEAFELLKNGRYPQAISAFKQFLANYPDGRFAANAQYWLGEANYVSRNFSEALEQFSQVLSRYPASPKVADSRLKIGYTHYELEDWGAARRTLEELVRDYPDSSVARLAQQRLIRMKSEGR